MLVGDPKYGRLKTTNYIGGIQFHNVTVRDRHARPWAAHIGATGVGAAQGRGAADIMGDVTVYNPNGCWCDWLLAAGQGGMELIDAVVGCHHSASL
jgi:hypothetical protein